MKPTLVGLHHVTAITQNAQLNLDFYTQQLGLRLVKLTVNFDDPSSYHLYYGDGVGTPGTIMTFFAGAGAWPGRVGSAQVTATTFAAPPDSLDYWQQRLQASSQVRFGQKVLIFQDPDGLPLEMVEGDAQATTPYDGPVAHDYALRGFAGVTLQLARTEATAELLTQELGFTLQEEQEGLRRFRSAASTLDLVKTSSPRGSLGAGTVHHVAWRTPDDEQQVLWRNHLQASGQAVSPLMDRNYFHSIYFREPGGVLFEIATDPPGFAVDQPLEELGRSLVLPAWLEPRRAQITAQLPRLQLATP